MSDAVLGLSIGPHDLRATEVVFRRRAPQVTAVAIEPLEPRPPGDDADTVGLDLDRILPALRRLLDANGFRARRVVVGLDGELALIRRTELPVVASGPIRAAAALGVEELLSYPISEAIFDVVEMGRREEGELSWVDAVVVAVRHSIVAQVHELCDAVGLRLVETRLLPTAFGVGAGAIGDTASAAVDGGIAVVEVEEESTDVALFDHEGLVFSRTLAVGIGHAATSMAAELEAHIQAITGHHEDRPDHQAEPEFGADVGAVTEAVRRTFVHYETLVGVSVARVVLVGARAATSGLVEGLERALDDGTGEGPAVSLADMPSGFPDPACWPTLAGAYGLVAARPQRPFDLRLPAQRTRQNRVRRLVAGGVLALLAMALGIPHGLSRYDELLTARDQVAANEATVLAIETRVLAYEDLAVEVEEVAVALDQEAALADLALDLPGVARQVAASMPTDSYLLTMRLERLRDGTSATEFGDDDAAASFSLTGVTDELDGVADWLDSLDGTAPFTGVWLTQSAYGPLGADDVEATLFVVDGGLDP